MRLHRTLRGAILETGNAPIQLVEDWDTLMRLDDLHAFLSARAHDGSTFDAAPASLAPVARQEVWAAGVTYLRSKSARVEESKDAGGGSFYDRVYDAPRPELFHKCAGWRARGPGETVRIRRDATWSVPEPEIALCINPHGRIVGYTIGNDMSSRDIEGANPLYLPQAKTYDGSCALGPAILVTDVLPKDTSIELRVRRDGLVAFEGATEWSRMRRSPQELVEWLYRETSFPNGCVLLTGTGIVPPDAFTLRGGDEIEISVSGIGTLRNIVEAS